MCYCLHAIHQEQADLSELNFVLHNGFGVIKSFPLRKTLKSCAPQFHSNRYSDLMLAEFHVLYYYFFMSWTVQEQVPVLSRESFPNLNKSGSQSGTNKRYVSLERWLALNNGSGL